MSVAHSEGVEAIETTAPSTSSSPGRTELVPLNTDAHMLVQSDTGRFIIHQEVVAKIIGLAVREVPGVHELAPFGTGDRLARLADRITGHDTRDLGVQVEIGTVECAADVRIVCIYGISLPEVGNAVRERVIQRVNDMTGLTVRELNIEVVDLYFDNDSDNDNGRQLR